MKESYWEGVADSYESKVFSVLEHDRKGLVLNVIAQCADQSATAYDLGCGLGSFTPALASNFKHVVALDISCKLLKKAKARCAILNNISYENTDLTKPRTQLPNMGFALSVNAIITASRAHRVRMFDTICKQLRPDGHFVLVVPSVESVLLTDSRLIEWNLRSGMSPRAASGAGFRVDRCVDDRNMHEGIVSVDGVGTKHYLREELIALLERRRMTVLNIKKIEYSWDTEFESTQMDEHPFPLGLVVCREENTMTHDGRALRQTGSTSVASKPVASDQLHYLVSGLAPRLSNAVRGKASSRFRR